MNKVMIGGLILPAFLGIAFTVDISNGSYSSHPGIYLGLLSVFYALLIFLPQKYQSNTLILLNIFAVTFLLPSMFYTVGNWKDTTPFLLILLLRVACIGMIWINRNILLKYSETQ